MAHFGKDLDNFSANNTIKISKTETVETYTIYVIEVTIGAYTWTVKHRYSDFHELNEKLCANCKLDRNLLPPKKLFGNQTEGFIRKRQHDLEVYLQTVLYYVSHKIPSCLADFLHFDLYEIHGITQVMAEDLYSKGDLLLQAREIYRTTPLHLYSLTERLKLPEPTCDSGDVKRDIGHILDFITRLKGLQVYGGQKVGTSNIDMNQLPFDLTLFKSLQSFELVSCDICLVKGLETVKQTLKTLTINKSLESIRSVLLQDMPQWKADDGTLLVSHWEHITKVDLSYNTIEHIDDSIQLMPRVTQLNLSHNLISTIQHLQWLSHMTSLDLSHNALERLEALHSKLGNLKTLRLAGNKLSSLQGLSKLFSLENLDISYNQIAEVEDVKCITGLPCLENLELLGNPVTITLDYRTKTLALFGDRVSELVLDKEKANQKELDTVAVLQAIQKSKEKAKDITVKKVGSKASLSDLSPSPSTSYSRIHGNSQSSGNQVREPIPLMQKYNLFKRVDECASPCVAVDAFPRSSFPSSPAPGLPDHLVPPSPASRASNLSLPGLTQNSTTSSYSSPRQPYSQDKEKLRISPGACQSSSPLPRGGLCVDISSLPTHSSENFTSWLHTRLFGEGDNSSFTLEKIQCVLWCPVVQYSNSRALVPCCVVLTERRIFILQLRNRVSAMEGVPDLETFYILPLCNIQQVLIGPCYSFVRVEESFVGHSGTFVLLAGDSESGKEFFEGLSILSEKEADNCGLNLINGSQNSDLSKQIFEYEETKEECTGRVVFAAHVHVTDTQALVYLLLTENRVYIVKTPVIFWPKPTFDANQLECVPQFEVAQQFSVEGRISDLQTSTAEAQPASNPITPDHNISFSQAGLAMTFHELLGSHKFDFQFFTAKARDMFLERLTNLRSEYVHRMSPNEREAPEGGNESSDESEDEYKVKQPEQHMSEGENVSKGQDSDHEFDSDTESQEACDKVETLQEQSKQRKLRSKTEITISTSAKTKEGETELPSYTWHYLSRELTQHLENCVKDYTLLQTVSAKLYALVQMSGEEVAKFFHNSIVPVGVEGEELHHILWTNVIPYTNPSDEIVTCVMLSNRAVYLVSDRQVKVQQLTGQRPSWMTHARHVSDSIIGLQAKLSDRHHCSGILHGSQHEGAIVKPYCILDFSEIHQINVGLFDQCVRLTGTRKETVFTLVTRNSEASSLFMKHLSTMLSLYVASPMLDMSTTEMEQDFYKAFNKRTKTTVDGLEYVHPSKVKFCYPGDESVSDLLFIINEHLKSIPLKVGRENILQYILGFRMQAHSNIFAPVLLEPISIILTNECLCFVTEDLISYPLPEFVRGLPGTPQQYVTDVKKLEYLKCVKQVKDNPRDITLTFSDEKEDIVLIPDHYSMQGDGGRDSPPEIPVRLCLQSFRELSKFLLLLQSQWKERHQELDQELLIVQI